MRSRPVESPLDEWALLCRHFPVGWKPAARSLGALRRGRRIRDPSTLLRCLLVHLADGCSLAETSVRVRTLAWAEVSPVALFKRLQSAEQWLRWLAEQLWRQQCCSPAVPGRRVRAVDATTVDEPGRTGSVWRVHYTVNLADLQCDFFSLTDKFAGERFQRIPLQAGDVILGDRAYGTPPGVGYVRRNQSDVLVRINLRMLPLWTESGRRVGILSRLRKLRIGEIKQWPTWVHHDGERFAGRLVAVKRSRTAAAKARRQLKRRASRRQKKVSAAVWEAAQYTFVWTSLPEEDFPADVVMELYRLRWQIELTFKRMKSILGLGQLPKQTDASARAWLHGKLFVALLIERLIREASDFSPWGYRLEQTT
jgi:hypothetical protein